MSEKISPEQVRHVARLARLKLTDEQLLSCARELGAILDYVEQLDGVDTEGVEPLSHPLALANVFREDRVESTLDSDAALSNAPQRQDNFFQVPKVLDQGEP
ncbi:MAG: Asp-tRNA(Asn)/Glu-tRNA(Gln) amidotransferase subunit GatC [Phycisphaerae bacterium]